MRRHVGLVAATAAGVLAASGGVALAGPPAAPGGIAGGAIVRPDLVRPAVVRPAVVNVSNPVRAIRTARRNVHALPYSIDRERFRGAAAWEIELVPPRGRALERIVGIRGLRVLRRGTVRRPADASHARQARVALGPAVQHAARRAAGHLEGADIDRERGQIVWSVIFLRGHAETEVYVSVRTGRVIRVEHDH